MPSNRLEEIRERVGNDMYLTIKPKTSDECIMQQADTDLKYLLLRLRLAEAVVTAWKDLRAHEQKPGMNPPDWDKLYDAVDKQATAYDAFLSASNPEAGGGKEG